MQRKNFIGATLASLCALILLSGCQHQEAPTPAQIELAGMSVVQKNDTAAEDQLRAWAEQGLPVAQRELAIVYLAQPDRREEAKRLFGQAACKGDAEAAFQLGEMLRVGGAGVAGAPGQSWSWYKLAALQKHARAALVLGMLYKNGDGIARDDAQAAHWLEVASGLGNAHATFLLSAFYTEGRGVPQDSAKGRALLEEAAEHDYPPAIQELAMTVQTGDALSPKDELRASHLLKEATEHRHNNWNRF